MLKNKNHYTNDSITVTELNKCVRQIIENNIGDLWVHGEISKLTLHSSGHWYFTLKDDKAAVACAMFQRDNINVTFKLKDGQKVFVFAQPSLYEISGRYQLIVLKMEDAGKGDLQKKFELLKNLDLAEYLITSKAEKVLSENEEMIIEVNKAKGEKCPRCWKILEKKCERESCPIK